VHHDVDVHLDLLNMELEFYDGLAVGLEQLVPDIAFQVVQLILLGEHELVVGRSIGQCRSQ
jgi:hypothetical protein